MLRWPFGKRREVERLPPQTAYSLWAPTYPPQPHNDLMKIEHDAVMSMLPQVRGLIVLDAGCGTGRYMQELAGLGARPVGIDMSAAMLDRARSITPRLARADLRALPFDAMSIDVIVCGLALGDVAELELCLAEMARVLRPGGTVVYSVVHPRGERLGWARTFDSGGRQWAIDGHWHSVERHHAACAAADLTIEDWREPSIETHADPVALVVKATR